MKSLLLLAMSVCGAAGQMLDGISAPVSRRVTLVADEASIAISVTAALDATQQQVKQALQSAGLPNPTVVATGLGDAAQILFSAAVAIPAGSAIETAKNLEALRTHLPDPLKSLQYAVAFNPSQTAIDALRQLLLPQLLDESRKQAQSLAAAAGIKLGPIRAISDVAGAYNLSFARIGIYDPRGGIPLSLPSSTQYTYYLNVVFATAP
ncbi:MAG: hypothetical protein JWP63_4229 [Candidatus Solibacter sp.]|nr:hypothetical protein [Candidatus Solibacter sp.]